MIDVYVDFEGDEKLTTGNGLFGYRYDALNRLRRYAGTGNRCEDMPMTPSETAR